MFNCLIFYKVCDGHLISMKKNPIVNEKITDDGHIGLKYLNGTCNASGNKGPRIDSQFWHNCVLSSPIQDVKM